MQAYGDQLLTHALSKKRKNMEAHERETKIMKRSEELLDQALTESAKSILRSKLYHSSYHTTTILYP